MQTTWTPKPLTATELANLAAYEASLVPSRSELRRQALDTAYDAIDSAQDDISTIRQQMAQLRADLADAVSRRESAQQSIRRILGK